MKMRFIICGFTLAFTLAGVSLSAQENIKTQEFGFGFDIFEGIDNSSFFYKRQAKNNGFWRLKYNLGGYTATTFPEKDKYKSANSRIGIGYEKRHKLSGNAVLTTGLEPFWRINWDKQKTNNETNSSLNWGTGIGIPVGVIFNASAKWFVGLETTPFFGISRTTHDDLDLYTDGNYFEFAFNGIYVNFGYRFQGKK